MTSPYRQAPQSLLCPRCGEMLDSVFAGVSACPRCQGAWIAQPTLDAAFGDPRWPKGHGMWWHDELECPECKLTGDTTKMSARGSGEVLVDACPSHGLWLDRGELSRLLRLEAGSDELLELQFRVTPSESDVEDLEERRRAWRTEREARGKAAAALRAELEELQKRRAAELAEEAQQRRAEDKAAREREAAESQIAAVAAGVEHERANEEARATAAEQVTAEVAKARDKARADAEARATREALIRSYRDERNEIRQRISFLRIEVTAGEQDLKVMQAQLAAQHRAVSEKSDDVASLAAELDGLEARLQAIDSHLAREGA